MYCVHYLLLDMKFKKMHILYGERADNGARTLSGELKGDGQGCQTACIQAKVPGNFFAGNV